MELDGERISRPYAPEGEERIDDDDDDDDDIQHVRITSTKIVNRALYDIK
jgi:hypothetical protein